MIVRDSVEEGSSDMSTVQQPDGSTLSARLHAIAFWSLVVFLAGACAGIGAAFKYHSYQMDRTVQLGSFIHDNVVYDVRQKGLR